MSELIDDKKLELQKIVVEAMNALDEFAPKIPEGLAESIHTLRATLDMHARRADKLQVERDNAYAVIADIQGARKADEKRHKIDVANLEEKRERRRRR